MLLALPHDLTRLVVDHVLQAHGLCALEACCRALRELVDDDVWRSAYLRRHRRSILCEPASWKEEYARRTLWSRSWRQLSCTSIDLAAQTAAGQQQSCACVAGARPLKLLRGAEAAPCAAEAALPVALAGPPEPTKPAHRQTLMVDARRASAGEACCFASIAAALSQARPLDTVVVSAGVYHERLRLDVDVELIGTSPPGSTTIVGIDGPAIEARHRAPSPPFPPHLPFHTHRSACRARTLRAQVSSGASRVANMCIRHQTRHGDGAMGGAVLARAGATLVLEDCEVSSEVGHCVIAQGACLHLLHNAIGHARGVGVLACENACGVIKDNDISRNGRAGVAILTGANPLVCRNKIHDGLDSGVMVSTRGRGTIEDNDICANCRAGVAILAEGQPTVRANRIYDGHDSGVLVCEQGQGSIVDNQIYANAMAGLAIGKGGRSRVTGNTIRDGQGGSLCLSLESNGLIVANVIQLESTSSMHVPDPLLSRLQEQNLVIQHAIQHTRRAAPAVSTILHIQRHRREARARASCRALRISHRPTAIRGPAVAKVRLALQRAVLQQQVVWTS